MPILHRGDLSISYLDEGAGPPAVLIHCGGLSSRQWRRLASRLAPARRVIAPDLRGYGASTPWPADAPFHFDEDARLIDAVLDTAGAPVDLVGHSYGGLLALTVAARRPRDIRSLAVYEPGAYGVLHDPPDAEALAYLAMADPEGLLLDDATGGKEPWLERFVDHWNGEGAWRALPAASREGFVKTGRKLYQEIRATMQDRTSASTYRLIDAPALILEGSLSPLPDRRVCARLAATLPRASLVTIEGAWHMGPIKHAAAVNDVIEAHINRPPGSS